MPTAIEIYRDEVSKAATPIDMNVSADAEASADAGAPADTQAPADTASPGYGWDDAVPTDDGDGRRVRDAEHDAELEEMQREAPLLDLIRQDTGEAGREGGGIVYFDSCPVCGHRECFRFYPETNTWSCFGASNADRDVNKKADGGGYIRYVLRTGHASDDAEAVRMLREATGRPLEAGEGTKDKVADGLQLPPWEPIRASDPPSLAPELIGGLLRRGHTGILVARAKSGKSWALTALSVAVATGAPWLGFPCQRGNVLFVDPEIDYRSLCNRFNKVAEAMGADPAEVDARVIRWSLRGALLADGNPPTITNVLHDIAHRIKAGDAQRGDFAIVAVDSCSCVLSGDENTSLDVRRFHNLCLSIAEITGASVMCVHHEGKAASGDVDAMSRGRGSSAWSDAFDLVLSLVETFPPEGEVSDYLSPGERSYSLDVAAIREFPPLEPARLVFAYPVFRPAEGITDGWKPRSAQQAGGRKTADKQRDRSRDRAQRCEIALLAHMYHEGIGTEGMPGGEAASYLSEALGETVKPTTLKGYITDSSALSVYQKSAQRWCVVPSSVPVWQRQGKLIE